jgi:Ca2+-binding EF-hand superfamily protein
MLFRIADKTRDRKISVNNFSEIIKRLHLRMGDVEINQLCNLISKTNQIHYEEYLQCLSAFQVNS